MELDTIACSDVMDYLRSLPGDSVDCCVSSPPYMGLRDYGTAQWEGGDPECSHQVPTLSTKGPNRIETPDDGRITQYKDECQLCGAVRIDRQIGLEPTPQEYVVRIVEVFREVRRVLKPTGVVFLNVGDSYAGGGGGNYTKGDKNNSGHNLTNVRNREQWIETAGLKPKDLMLIPQRLAIALQDDGWYVRAEIIWHKTNGMPESVTDRPTRNHEQIWLLTKREKYFYDAEAIKTPALYPDDNRKARQKAEDYQQRAVANRIATLNPKNARPYPASNARTVWTITPQPTKFAHFATFPQTLVERCILAGCPAQVCAECGKPHVRITEREFVPQQDVSLSKGIKGANGQKAMYKDSGWQGVPRGTTAVKTLGWQPTCSCNADTDSGICLDPFMGSGTTALVARRLGRHYLGCDLNPEYVALTRERLRLPFEGHHIEFDNDLSDLPLFSHLGDSE